MNGRISRYGAPGIVALLVAALAFPGALGAEPQEDLATATVYSGGVDFLPNVDYSRAVLTVSGNGSSFSRVAYPGERLSIGMFDPEGQPLADGVYRWQLELRPSAEAAWELKKAASRNGGEAPAAWQPQTGAFAIRNGLIADPELTEPGASRRNDSAGAGLSAAFGPSTARAAATDSDDAVGSQTGVEAQARSAAGDVRRAASALGLESQPSRGAERSDATAYALGQSLETPTNDEPAAHAAAAASARRSASADGANGRPRSADDQ